MKLYLRLILSGVLLIALAFTFAACSGGAKVEPSPVAEVTEEPVVATEAPTEVAAPILEIVGLNESKFLTMEELKALPATEGYAGLKSSTGKITPPVIFKGVALKDLAEFIGGMDETTGFNVVAEDGYSITYSFDQLQNGSFIAYDPATGEELKNPVELTAILAYEVDGKPFDAKQDGALRLAIISAELNQVTDGHWSVKWVNKLEVKSLGAEWALHLVGARTEDTDRVSVESCGAPQCHGSAWTDDKAQEWVGVPLWLFVGSVDDEIEHEGPAFNDALAEAGYSVDVIASDGYTVTFDAARINRNDNILVAYKVNENPLPDEFFPLRLVGSDLEKKEMAGMIAEIHVGVEPLADVPAAASTEPAAATISEADATLIVFGSVNQQLLLNEAALREMEVLTINAEHPKNGKQDFEGVSLNALLDLAGVKDGATTLVFIAADGYTSEISLEEVRACTECLVGFTNTLEKFKMVMPNLPSSAWAKDVIKIEVK